MLVQAEQHDQSEGGGRPRFRWSAIAAPLAIVAILGAALATSPRAAWHAPQLTAAPGQQVHYLPFDAQQFFQTLEGQQGATLTDTSMHMVGSIVSSRDSNTVAIDHWEDGYDADPVNSPGATTEVLTMNEGQVKSLTNDVVLAQIGQLDPNGTGDPYYDGRDKIVSTAPTVVIAGGWGVSTGTVHAGSSAVPEVSRYGYDFVSPVGEDTPYPAGSPTVSPWEYTGLIIVASQDGTTVNVTGNAPITLDEGDTHLIDGGINVGDAISADKPIAVYLSTGDNGANYEGRMFELTPTERWTDTYFSPVTSTNNTNEVTRVFLYNPGAAAITVDVTRSNATTTTVNVPAGGQANYLFPQDVGAKFESPGHPFYALQAITTPEPGNDDSSAYNWGFSLIPEAYLTPMVVIGYGNGSSNLTANQNGVWIAPQADTTVYVDRDGDTSTGASTDANGNKYDFSCSISALVPKIVKDDGSTTCYTPSTYTAAKGTGDADMTGARIYTLDGTTLAAAWGQIPGLTPGSPAIDMGTTILPFPTVNLTKSAEIVNDDGDGLVDAGETIRYTITAENAGIAPVDNLVLEDTIPDHTTYVPGSTIHNGAPVADDAGPASPFPFDEGGHSLPPALNVGQTRTVSFDVVADNPLDPSVTQIVNQVTLATSYGTYTAINVEPTAPPEPSIALAKTVYRGHDGGASCQGADQTVARQGDDVTYCFAITNDGSMELAPVTLADPDLGIDQGDVSVASGDLSSMDPGATTVLYYETTVDGDLTNTATATGTPANGSGTPTGDDPVTATDTASVDQVAPALTVDKTVYRGHDDGALCAGGETAIGVVGDPVTYCFVVTNTGDTTLAPVTLDDADLGIDQVDMTLSSGTLDQLDPGDVATLYYETNFKGDLTNTVGASGTPADPNGDPLGLPSVTGDDTATAEQVAPSASIAKTVYLGHDGGASCGTSTDSVTGLNDADVTYCFVVTNTGDTSLTPVTVADGDLGIDQDAMTFLSGTLDQLDPGDSATLFYDATIDGDLTNTATVTAVPVDGGGAPIPGIDPVGDSDTASVDGVGPAVLVDKSVYLGHDAGAGCAGSDTVFAHSGEDVTYCFTVTNNGDTDLAPVTVDDPDLGIDETDMGVLSGDLATLAPGDSAVLFFETTVDGDLDNTATATGTPVDGGGDPIPNVPDVTHEDTAHVDEVAPAVSVAKTVYRGHDGGAGCPGGELVRNTTGTNVTYCFTVSNDGDTTLSPVTVVDADLGIDQSDMTVLSGDLAALDPGDTAVLSYETTIDGDLTNTATVTGTPTDGGRTPLPGIADVTGTDTAEVDEVGPAISVAKTVYAGHDGGAGCPGVELQRGANGADLTYCFEITNDGDTTLADLTLDDADLGIDQSDVQIASGSLDAVAPGDSVVVFYETTLDGDLTNTATAGGTPVDGNGDPIDGVDAVSATDTAAVQELTPSIAIDKSVYRGHDDGASCAGAASVVAPNGDAVTYCFVVTNNGGADLANVTIDDGDLHVDDGDMALLSGSLAALAPGDSATLYYETAVDGDLVNTATATGDPVDGGGPLPGATPPTATDTATVDSVSPHVSVAKTVYRGHDDGASCEGSEQAAGLNGDAVTYCFVVTNDGDTTLAPVTLTDADLGVDDSQMGSLSGDLGQLDPGDSATLFYETTIDGDLTNTATASGTPADSGGDPFPGLRDVTGTDTASVDEVAPSISVAKTVYRGHDDGAGCPGGESVQGATGANVTYCFAVTNDGNTTLFPVTVTDADLGISDTQMAGDTAGLASLEPGDTAVVYYETTLDGDLTNTAVATGTPVDGGGDPLPGVADVADQDTASVDDVSPNVSIDKTVYRGHDGGAGCPGGESVSLRSGANLTYCFVVTNNGDTTLSPVHVTDADLGNIDEGDMTLLSGALDSLAVGQSAVLYYETTVDGDLTNTASAAGDPVDDQGDPLNGSQSVTDQDTASVDEVAPAVSVAKTVYRGHDDGAGCEGSEQVAGLSGDAVTYCFVVSNDGDTTLAPVTLDDGDLGITDADMSGDTASLASLAPGATAIVYYETTIDGDLPNTVTATATPADDQDQPLPGVPDVTGTDTASVDEVAPAINIAKTVYRGHDSGASCPGTGPVTARAGDDVTYCFIVTNPGDTTLSPVHVTDAALGGIDEQDMSVVSGDLSALAPGDTVVLAYETTVDGDLTNTAIATGTPVDDQIDPLPGIPDVTDSDTTDVDEVHPAISLVKTVYRGHDAGAGCNGVDVLSGLAGEDLTYCFTVTNTGDTTVSPVSIDDPDIGITDAQMAGDTAGLASLDPGQSATVYYETTVSGDLHNTATATATPADGQGTALPGLSDVTADDDAQVWQVAPSLSVAKTVYRGHDDGAGCEGSNLVAGRNGDPVTYCFVVTNDGDTPLTGLQLGDAALGLADQSAMTVLSGDLDRLDPDETATLYYETTLNGDVVNTAVVSGSPSDDNGDPLPGVADVTDQDTAAVDTVGPAVMVAKTVYRGHDDGAGCDGGELVDGRAGDAVTYCFTVTNNGDTDLSPVTVVDDDLGIDQSDLSGPTANLATMEPGDTVTLWFETTLEADLVNTAVATGTPVDAQGDPLGISDATDQDTAQAEVVAPSISVAKTVYRDHDDGAGCPGSESISGVADRPITYCFVVTNDGDTTLAPVTLDDADLGIDQATMSVLSGDLSSLAPGDSATLFYETTVDGDLINTVTATGTPVDGTATPLPGVADVTDADDAHVDQIAPSMTLLTEVSDPLTGNWFDADNDGSSPGSNDPTPATVRSGDTASFRFTVTNTGDASLSDVVVDAPACDAAPQVVSGDTTNPGVLDVGETWVLSCDVSDVTAGFTLDATVTGDSIDGPPTGSGTDETARVQVSSISIDKRVLDPTSNDFVDSTTVEDGGDATFQIIVTNDGEVPLADIAVDDPLAPDCIKDFVESLDPGDSFAAYTCLVQDVGDGFVNTATATATPVDDAGDPVGDDVSADDAAAVAVDGAPVTDLSITKDLVAVDDESSTATWQVTVTNVGDTDATQPITVTDDLPDGLEFLSAGGDGWSCDFEDPTVTCLTDTDLAQGGSTVFTITTYVARNPDTSVTNVARVDGTDDTNTDNNQDDAVVDVSDQGTIQPQIPTDLARTGADIAGWLLAAGFCLASGGALVWASKRRRRTA